MTEETATYQADSDRQPKLVSIGEAASILGVSERTIWRKIKQGKLNSTDINGRTCIQLTGYDTPTKPTSDNGRATDESHDKTTDTVTVLQAKLEQALRDTINRQADEIVTLRTENAAKQATIDNLTRMLPAPTTTGPDRQSKPKGSWFWPSMFVLAVILAASLLAVVYFTIIRPAQESRPARYQTASISRAGSVTQGRGYFAGPMLSLYPYR